MLGQSTVGMTASTAPRMGLLYGETADGRPYPGPMQPLARHLLRARDLADARYTEPLTVADMAGAAGLSTAHFSRGVKRSLRGSPPHHPPSPPLYRYPAPITANPRAADGTSLPGGYGRRRAI